MKALRVFLLSLLLVASSAVAFSPSLSFADLTSLIATQLSNTVLMVQTIAGTAGAIYPNTVSGTDSASICLSGGSLNAGACTEARGSVIIVNGKQNGSQPDALQLSAGSGSGSGEIAFRTGGSGTVKYDNSGNVIQQRAGTTFLQAPFTGTPAATPVAGTNYCNGSCVVPTAAANAAVFIGAGTTPTPGAQTLIVNSNGTNTIRAKAVGASTINGSVAGGYLGLPANASVRCWQASATNLVCDSYSGGAVPTPAGP